ncbi:MAG TPA: Gfo/Idh/MocA family oxidoreductase [Ktedonobacteraceae bacterium]|jgi:predicted dehydrogenase|nr:Gfo/Idh/MocA family oxidoreductase [Ktedonobacteraceae bacterium]
MTETKINVGVIGCGVVSTDYFKVLPQFSVLDIVACADLNRERAETQAAHYHIPRVCSPEEILADPQIDIVVNLTTPGAHAKIGMATLQAGKSLYTEKPLTVSREEARQLLETAQARGVLVGCAPDTFLGTPLQTCRKLIDDGEIGQPIAVSACMMTHGPENWHPDPAFYYQPGGGPMFDMGPYYLTALVSLLGPVRRVMGATKTTYPERVITSQPNSGVKINVQTPTHVAGIIDFASGVIGTITTSFEVWASEIPAIEIYGTEGTLSIPNPSYFAGPIRSRGSRSPEWHTLPLTSSCHVEGRGLGIVDMAHSLRSGHPHRASGALAYHVLDSMHAFHEAALKGSYVELNSACDRPEPLVMEELA